MLQVLTGFDAYYNTHPGTHHQERYREVGGYRVCILERVGQELQAPSSLPRLRGP